MELFTESIVWLIVIRLLLSSDVTVWILLVVYQLFRLFLGCGLLLLVGEVEGTTTVRNKFQGGPIVAFSAEF